MKKILFLFIMIIFMSCGAGYRYTPVVDLAMTGKSHEEFQHDLMICQEYAKNGVNPLTQTAKSGVGTAATGAAAGAIIGSVFGTGVGSSAGRGAAVGGAVGVASGYSASRAEQERIVRNCMKGRGYTDLRH